MTYVIVGLVFIGVFFLVFGIMVVMYERSQGNVEKPFTIIKNVIPWGKK